MISCDCCDEPICTTPTIVCDSISASKTKCGFGGFFSAGVTYRTRNFNGCTSATVLSNSTGGKKYLTFTTTTTGLTDPVHCGTPVMSGSIVAICHYDTPCTPNGGTLSCSGSITRTSGSGCSSSSCSDSGGIKCGFFTSPDSYNAYPCITQIDDLSDEYTTALLIANTVAALPSYPGTFAGTCSAFRDLSSDETSYTIRRFKFKMQHYPTASCYLKVWLRTRFRPEGTSGGSDVLTDLTPYEWTGSPSDNGLCFTDSTKPYNDTSNKILSSPSDEIAEPSTDGTLSVEITKWSCLEGYEPDDPNDDGTRPSPDVNPNGWPKAA